MLTSLLLLRPHSLTCMSDIHGSLNGSNLPGQTDSQQGITTRQAGEAGLCNM